MKAAMFEAIEKLAITQMRYCVYKICEEVKAYLLQPKGLFHWK